MQERLETRLTKVYNKAARDCRSRGDYLNADFWAGLATEFQKGKAIRTMRLAGKDRQVHTRRLNNGDWIATIPPFSESLVRAIGNDGQEARQILSNIADGIFEWMAENGVDSQLLDGI